MAHQTIDEILKNFETSRSKNKRIDMDYGNGEDNDHTSFPSAKKAIADLIAREVIGEDLPVFGAENEAGDVSLESYENAAINSKLAEQRKALEKLLGGKQ